MTAAKTSISKRRAVPKSSESADTLTPLRPETRENDVIDGNKDAVMAGEREPGTRRRQMNHRLRDVYAVAVLAMLLNWWTR